MKEVYNQFIEAVNGMRKDQYASDVYIIYPLHSQTDDTIIFHDEALLPHWREVAVARKSSLYASAVYLAVYSQCISTDLIQFFSTDLSWQWK